MCRNYKLIDTLAEEILNTVNRKAEYNNYDCDEEDIGKARLVLIFGLQRIIDINGQKITLALELSNIYKANNIEEIWLFDSRGSDETELSRPYEEFIYPITVFKGSNKVWEEGKDELYKVICNGRYGTYDGRWVDLNGINAAAVIYCKRNYPNEVRVTQSGESEISVCGMTYFWESEI